MPPAAASLAPLRSAPYRWLFLGATISSLGSSIAPVALAFAVLDLTGSVTSLGIIVGARSIASVIFLLVGGVAADRLPRGLVLGGSSVASALTQGAVAVVILTKTDSVALLALLSALNGTVTAFSLPAAAALLPQTVPATDLVQANALSRLGTNSATVLGTAVAGVLVVAFGSGWGIAVDAASYLIAAALFALVTIVGTPSSRTRTSMLRDLTEGWSEFIARTWLWVVVAAFTVINAAIAAGTSVLGPQVADETIGRRAWGFVLAAQAVGLVAGGLIAIRLSIRHLLAFGMVCVAGAAFPLLALGLHLGFGPVLAAAFIAGLGIEQFGVAWQTSMQHHVPSHLLARVTSYDMLGSIIAVPIGQIAAGPIGTAIGARNTLIGGGGLIIIATALTLLSRSVRTLNRQ